MSTETFTIDCTNSLSISESDGKIEAADEFLMAGDNCQEKWEGFLYFDLSMIPSDVMINSAVLKIYIQKSEILGNKSTIYFQPLLIDYSKRGIFESEYNCPCPPVKIAVNTGFQGWLAINILDITKQWHHKSIKNYGLLIHTECGSKSLFTFNGRADYSSITQPQLLIGIINKCPMPIRRSIEVYEEFWSFNFFGTELSPPICVEQMKQGSFYILNKGPGEIRAFIETSADLVHWVKDAGIVIIENETNVLVAKYYSKFYRIRLVSTGFSKATVRFIEQYYL
jgi:hypothetical protein